jgi:hypothetical protein
VVVWDAPVAFAIRASHQVWAICAGQLPGFSRFGGWHLYPLLIYFYCGGLRLYP